MWSQWELAFGGVNHLTDTLQRASHLKSHCLTHYSPILQMRKLRPRELKWLDPKLICSKYPFKTVSPPPPNPRPGLAPQCPSSFIPCLLEPWALCSINLHVWINLTFLRNGKPASVLCFCFRSWRITLCVYSQSTSGIVWEATWPLQRCLFYRVIAWDSCYGSS